MDTNTLVEDQVESGQRLIEQLVNQGFEVTAAFWVKVSEIEGPQSEYSGSGNVAISIGGYPASGNVAVTFGPARWYLYIASPKVDEGLAKAYQLVFAMLQSMPDLSISMSQVKLIGATNPTTRQMLEIQRRFPKGQVIRLGSTALAGLSSQDGYVYPSRKVVPATLLWIDPKPAGAQDGEYPNAQAAIKAARELLPNAVVLVQWADTPPTTVSEAWIWRNKEEADNGSVHAAKVVSEIRPSG